MEKSGFSKETNPLMFKLLYERHSEICLCIFSFIFLLLVINWRKSNLRYQFRKSIGLILMMVYINLFSSFQGYLYIIGGRYWAYFSTCSIACNDTFAYFAGRLFGNHHLIGLSPNKTVEGFIGAFVSNIICTVVVANIFLKGDFWQCAPGHLNYGLFEEWTCAEYDPIYHDKEYQLPFEFMGYTSFTMRPAVLYSIFIATFASLLAPFLGFFASGFKRAVDIKDFSDTLPGHGGILDRVDCISIMCTFNYFMLK